MDALKLFATALAGFIVLDGVWLSVVMRQFYRDALGPIARTSPDGALAPIWAVAALVYLLLAAGSTFFVAPRVAGASLAVAFVWGALFGVVVYGVYDLTNWSTLKHYGATLALVDIAWGTFACGAVGMLLRWASK